MFTMKYFPGYGWGISAKCTDCDLIPTLKGVKSSGKSYCSEVPCSLMKVISENGLPSTMKRGMRNFISLELRAGL